MASVWDFNMVILTAAKFENSCSTFPSSSSLQLASAYSNHHKHPRITFAQSEARPGLPQAPRERNSGVHIERHWDCWGTGSRQRIPPKSPKSLSPGSYRCLAEQASVYEKTEHSCKRGPEVLVTDVLIQLHHSPMLQPQAS